MGISISLETRLDPAFPLSRRELDEVLRIILDALRMSKVTFELRVVDDETIAGINEMYLGCPGPTNILSFPAPEGSDTMGTMILSVDTLAREAALYGQEPLLHLARLLAHAALHLSGLDHGPKMDQRTDDALEAIMRRA